VNTFDLIYKQVSRIPRGKVSTYGAIAKKVGVTNPRVVGYALHVNKDPDNIPCHRVVNRFGEVAKGYAFGGLDVQKQLLEKEGVTFLKGKVLLAKHLYSL
jgi:methylated-DNA-protein-cysteine methyltransferase-like protein